jgi:hypothetical protein
MAAKIFKHKFQSGIADGADATLVRPQANWNLDDHDWRFGSRTVTAASDTIVTADEMSLLKYNNSGGLSVVIASPDTSHFQSGWLTFLRNIGTGVVTVLINTGSAVFFTGLGSAVSFSLHQGEDVFLISDGTNYDAIVRSGSLFNRRGQIPGIAGNVDATAGNVGYYIPNSGGPYSLTSGTGTSINAFSLGPGDWDIDGAMWFGTTSGNESATYVDYITGYFSLDSYGAGGGGPPQFAMPLFHKQPFLYLSGITKALPTTRILVPVGATSGVFVAATAGFLGLLTMSFSATARRVR